MQIRFLTLFLLLGIGQVAGAVPTESNKSRETALTLIEPLSKDEAEKARVRVESLGVLLKSEHNPALITKLRLNRAKVYIQIARGQGDKSVLDNALTDLLAVEKIQTLSAEERAFMFFLRGVVALDSGEYQQGLDFLRLAIKENPAAEYNRGLAMFLADEAYFSNHLDEAYTAYVAALKTAKAGEQTRAYYRLAWIAEKKGNYREAERQFLHMLGQKQLGDFRKDVVRDLAQLVPKFMNDGEILDFSKRVLKLKNEDELAFLRDVMVAEEDGGKHPSEVLLGRISQLTKNPGDRMALRLQRLRQESGAGDALDSLIMEFKGLTPADRKKVLTQSGQELQIATETSIDNLGSKFAKQTKKGTVPGAADTALGSRLLVELRFLEDNFRTKNRVKAIRLWLDVCATLQDWNCVLERAKFIAADKELASLAEPALLEQIAAYEGLVKTGPSQFGPGLRQALEDYAADPKRAEWPAVAKRLISLNRDEKNFAGAQALLEQMDAREKSEESFFRLQVNRFDQGLYSEVLHDDRPQFKSKRLADLRQESHLRLAKDASSSGGDFTTYEHHLKEYMKSVSDPRKRSALLKDFFDRLEKKRDDEKLYGELMSIDADTRFSPDIQDSTRRLLNRYFVQGQYARVKNLIGPDRPGAAEDLMYTRLLARLALNEAVAPRELNRWKSEKKTYLLGLFALTEPARVDAYLKSSGSNPKDLRDIGFLAYKIKSCHSVPPPGAAERALLGDSVPTGLSPAPPAAVEARIEKVVFAKIKKLTNAATAKMTQTLEQVRAIRKEVAAEVPDLQPAAQLRVFGKAEKLERGAAEMILTAPAPAALTPAQRSEYQARVAEMAKEFSTQAEQYARAAEKLGKSVAASRALAALPVKRLDAPEAWPWPQNRVLTMLKERDENKSLLTALIDLDFLQSLGSLESDYWTMRAGLLLSKSKCETMVEYVYQELQANKQNRLLQKWSHL
jgi:hypothetical protein